MYSININIWGLTGTINSKVIGESKVTMVDVEYDCYIIELIGVGQYLHQGETGT